MRAFFFACWGKRLKRILPAILVGCSRPDNSTEIRFAIAQAPLTLDPRYATDAASERVNRLIYRPLVDFDAHFRPVPALASWRCPESPMTSGAG